MPEQKNTKSTDQCSKSAAKADNAKVTWYKISGRTTFPQELNE